MSKKKQSTKHKVSEHSHFLALLILVVGFSSYAIASFFNSTNDYIDGAYVSVADIGVEAPSECASCPPFPVCSDVCEDVPSTVEPYPIFNDVYSDHKYAKAIESLYFAGVIKGYNDGTFGPELNVNRAEMLTMVTNAIGAELTGVGLTYCFEDVQDQWFAPFVCYAKNQGWVSGIGGFYKPDQAIIRVEALKIVLEASDLEVPSAVSSTSYSDVNTTDWFAPYVEVAFEQGIIDAGNFYGPSVAITRGELADMLYRAYFQ